MTAQTLASPMTICNFVIAFPEIIYLPEELTCISTRDYGFDFDEEELGNELLALLPAKLADQPIPEVDADGFEQTFQYFLS
jgi:hypothetical protein